MKIKILGAGIQVETCYEREAPALVVAAKIDEVLCYMKWPFISKDLTYGLWSYDYLLKKEDEYLHFQHPIGYRKNDMYFTSQDEQEILAEVKEWTLKNKPKLLTGITFLGRPL